MKKRISLVLTLAAAALTAAAFHVAQFAPVRDVPFSLGTEGGKVTAVEVFAPTNGSVALSSIYTADLFTNAVQITRSTNTLYTVVFSNLVDAVIVTNANNVGYAKTPYPYTPISSNSVSTVVATTNTWPVFKGALAVTNSIVTGSAESYKYSGAPAAATYLAPGETLLFTGTGVGGWLRIVLE